MASLHEPFPPLRSIPQESATISNSPPPVPAKNKSARASASVTFSISPPLIVRVTDQEADPVKVRVDTGVQKAGEVKDGVDVGVQEADEVKDGDDVAGREVDVVGNDVDVLDQEVGVVENDVVLDQKVGVVENDVDMLDQEVSVVKDEFDVDFKETCFKWVNVDFEETCFKWVDVDFEEIDVDKNEFRVIDNTPEDEEVAWDILSKEDLVELVLFNSAWRVERKYVKITKYNRILLVGYIIVV